MAGLKRVALTTAMYKRGAQGREATGDESGDAALAAVVVKRGDDGERGSLLAFEGV